MTDVSLHCGDCLDVLRTLDANSVDTVITDPPAGIRFMNMAFDSDRGGRVQWINWLTEIMAECLRVTKPGGSALVWSIPRTSHWTGTALEMAGWRVIDVITHIFGSGFPKSTSISKQLDKRAGVEREVMGTHRPENRNAYGKNAGAVRCAICGNSRNGTSCHCELPAPATEAARVWDGWGSALKPAAEFWWLCQKPLDGTYAENALAHGVAGLAIDRARIPANEELGRLNHKGPYESDRTWSVSKTGPQDSRGLISGRWPSNLILQCLCDTTDGTHDNPECPCFMLDSQSGERKSGGRIGTTYNGQGAFSTSPRPSQKGKICADFEPSTGGASRYFAQVKPDASRLVYCAKASRRERNAGLEGMPEGMPPGSKRSNPAPGRQSALGAPRANHHPTVKPLSLCRYLAKLTATPTGGTVLDPFMGSGSIGCAAVLEGRSFVGIEISEEYLEIAKRRIEYWQAQAQAEIDAAQAQLPLIPHEAAPQPEQIGLLP